jgi:hypothetical protein
MSDVLKQPSYVSMRRYTNNPWSGFAKCLCISVSSGDPLKSAIIPHHTHTLLWKSSGFASPNHTQVVRINPHETKENIHQVWDQPWFLVHYSAFSVLVVHLWVFPKVVIREQPQKKIELTNSVSNLWKAENFKTLTEKKPNIQKTILEEA